MKPFIWNVLWWTDVVGLCAAKWNPRKRDLDIGTKLNGWFLSSSNFSRIAQGSIYDDAGIEHYCSVECMNESKLYIAQLSDESIYHRKLVKEKPITPVKKPPVVPQQPREIIITENKNLNKDVDKFDTQDEPKKPIATAVVERNNSNSTKDNSKKTRQNYHLKNIMEKNKKMNDEEENEKFEYEHQEDFEEDDDDDNYDEAETPDFNQSHGEVVAAEFNSLSDFGKIWNLIMNWVTEGKILTFNATRSITFHFFFFFIFTLFTF